MKRSGIIVIDDAWPVTDALCLAFADWYGVQTPAERVRITYARMLATPWALSEIIGARNVEFRSLTTGTNRAEARQQLERIANGTPDDLCSILILQEKCFILLFYEMLAEPPFREQIRKAFGLVAADYALRTTMSGTDVLRRVGNGVKRLLISAQAEETFPSDWSSVCDERIDKSTVRIATLARRILEARGPSEIPGADSRDKGRDPCQES
jgi:hypothetical protein